MKKLIDQSFRSKSSIGRVLKNVVILTLVILLLYYLGVYS